MQKPSNYYDLPNSVRKLLRYNACTPDEEAMPRIYNKMTTKALLEQVTKLRDKRAKQLRILNDFIETVKY